MRGARGNSRALVVGLLWLCACAPAAAPASSPAPAAATAARAATAPAPTASAPSAAVPSTPPVAAHVRIASQFAATDVGHYIAVERGYYRQEGLDVELINFADASEMIPSLATDQVEVGGIGPNPATWNAVARGVKLKLVMDKGSVRPGIGYTALVIRKDVYDAGRGRSLTDLRGLHIAFTPPGKATTNAMPMAVGMERTGASLDDLVIEPLPFPDMAAALANGSVDGAMIVEPFLSRVLRQGTAVRVMGLDEMYPDFPIGQVGFASAFYANRPLAKALVRGYVRAVRDYDSAIAGRTGEADRAQIDEILSRNTRIDVATVHEMVPVGLNPNGRFNVAGVRDAYRWFREQGFIPEPVSETAINDLLGVELVDEVLAEIGRVPD
ncbi:MAG TPA: ABC transporter substrate-binding protein [Chloroflexota bacterium]|nr:ABC transporter substrate-binding protein [Chloroflexota bacterium]